MKTVNRSAILFILCFLCASMSALGSEIVRQPVFKIPGEIDSDLLGFRSVSGRIFAVSANGRYARYDMESQETFSGKLPTNRLNDFDIILGQVVFLDSTGRLGGRLQKNWPEAVYDATRIEVCNEGLFLSGGDRAYFLDRSATDSVQIDDLNFLLPVKNGFVYGFRLVKSGRWVVELLDNYGNLMRQIFEFSPGFSPVGADIGPLGPEGEMLISFYEGNQRRLCSIGNNGHMFWKILIPDKEFARDTGFDMNGNLLVLERIGSELWINRWKMVVPEG